MVTTVADAGLLGKRLRQLGAELRLREDSLDVRRLDRLDKRGELAARRLLADVGEDDTDELEAVMAREVRERVVEGHELAVRAGIVSTLGVVQLGVQRVDLCRVARGVRVRTSRAPAGSSSFRAAAMAGT